MASPNIFEQDNTSILLVFFIESIESVIIKFLSLEFSIFSYASPDN